VQFFLPHSVVTIWPYYIRFARSFRVYRWKSSFSLLHCDCGGTPGNINVFYA